MGRQSLDEWRGAVSSDLEHLKTAVGELPAQIEAIGKRFEDALKDHKRDDEKLTDRVSKVESKVAKYSAIGAIIAVVFSAICAAAANHYFG